MTKKNSVIKEVIIVTLITIVAGALLGLVHDVTATPIAMQQRITLENGQKEVFADASSFESLGDEDDLFAIEMTEYIIDQGISNTTVNEVYEALDASGECIGYIVDVTNNEGYGGDIEILAGVNTSGEGLVVNGISFLELSETAGMGMKAQDEPFIGEFNGLEADKVSVTGDESDAVRIDAISGATITSKAVVKDVNAALSVASYLKEGGSI